MSKLKPKILDASNKYNQFDLPFLTKKDGKIFNGKFDVTDAPKKLKGVFEKTDTVKLTDYLVYRPLPKALLTWREPPNVHPDSTDMEEFYAEIISHSINGVWVDGEYFNPLFVYWLNIFVFPVYILDSKGNPTEDFETSNPLYCNIDRYIFDQIWLGMLNRKDSSLMGGRGIGKSYIIGSIIDRNYRLFPESWTISSSTNEDTTNEAWNKIDACLNAIERKHRSIKHKRLDGGNNAELIQSGETIYLADGTTEEQGYLSKIEKIIYGKTPGKTRGKRPNLQHIEEFAAFPPSHQKGSLKRCITESKGSWFVGGSIKKCIVIYSGTGGTVENDEAETIFLNPKALNIWPTNDWEKECGIFIPTHIKRSGTWEDNGCPDITRAEAETDAERKAAMADPEIYLGLLQEYPKTLKEVFMRTGSNIFNQNKLAEQRTRLVMYEDQIKPQRGFLTWIKEEGTHKKLGVKWEQSNSGDFEITEHPYWEYTINEQDKNIPINDLYVAGCDSIDQGTADSMYATDSRKGSELAILVKKRILDKSYFKETSNLYVAKYRKRSADVKDDWDAALKLCVYYNCKVNIEYTKINIVSHFRSNGFYDKLMKRPTIARGDADPTKASNLIGTQASTPIIDHMDNKVKEYIDDYWDSIQFLDVIEQAQNYTREDRKKYDLIIALGLTELADEDMMGLVAKKEERETEGLELFGYYTDENGYKKFGIIPGKDNSKDSKEEMLKRAAEHFNKHGGVRWYDLTDPSNPTPHN